MLNQELTDYVKKCLEQGIGKEEIRKTLIQTGWQVGEVEAALGSFGGSVVKKSNLKLILSLGLLVLILAGGGFYWWQKSKIISVADKSVLPEKPLVKDLTQTYEGKVYGSIDGYLAKSLADYKKAHPSSTAGEIDVFSETVKKAYTQFHDGVLKVLASCASFPEVATSSINLNVDFKNMSESDPFFNQLKGSKLIPHPFTKGYAIYGGMDKGCLYKDTGDGMTWKKIKTNEDYFSFDVANEKAAISEVTCEDLDQSTVVDNKGFKNEEIWAIKSAPSDPSVIYAAVRDGGRCLYRSNDGGTNWKRVHINVENMVPQNLSFKDLVVDPKNLNHIYAVGGMFEPSADSGGWDIGTIIESRDGGINWSPVVIDGLQTSGLIVGNLGKYVYATAKLETMRKVTGTSMYSGDKLEYYLYRSSDVGKTWNKLASCKKTGSVFGTGKGTDDVVYAICDGVYKVSFDAGLTLKNLFSDSGPGVIRGVVGYRDVVVVGDAIYAWDNGYIYRSYDQGKSFEKIKLDINNVSEVVVSEVDQKLVFARSLKLNSYGSDIYRSQDGGKTWKKFGPDLDLGTYDTVITFAISDASKALFVGTEKGLIRIPIE